jgi:hypothetical protein
MGSNQVPSWVVGALVAVGVVALLVTAVRGHLKVQRTVREIDATLVDEYCRLIAAGKVAEAWERCMTADYRRAAPLADFVAAHDRRRAEVGTVQARELLSITSSRSLFTGVTEYQLHYRVDYPAREEILYVGVSDADGPPRIYGTYVSAASDTLDVKLW